jgi:hypothetical protein
MESGKRPKNWARCLAPKKNPMRDRSRILLHRSFSIIRRGIHSLSTTIVENREMGPEGLDFHRSLSEAEAMEDGRHCQPADSKTANRQ